MSRNTLEDTLGSEASHQLKQDELQLMLAMNSAVNDGIGVCTHLQR
jgi:hypothetical protein